MADDDQVKDQEQAEVKSESACLFIDQQFFPLNQEVTNIGRNIGNDLVIPDPHISREHAQILHIDDQYILHDLNSTGGSYVNKNKIKRCVLSNGDTISLASVEMVFLYVSPGIVDKLGKSTADLKEEL